MLRPAGRNYPLLEISFSSTNLSFSLVKCEIVTVGDELTTFRLEEDRYSVTTLPGKYLNDMLKAAIGPLADDHRVYAFSRTHGLACKM